MTGTTVSSKSPGMGIITRMAIITGGRRAFEAIVGVAGSTIDSRVGAGQRKPRDGMIKSGAFPGGGAVAGVAGGAKAAGMGVITRVAAVTG